MKKTLLYLTILAVACFAVACGSQQQNSYPTTAETLTTAAQATGITGIHWQLVELGGNAIETTSAFIFFNEDGTVHGNLGCNSFSGSFTQQSGNRISFSQLVNTQKFCLEGMDVEAEMAQVLQQADNYNLTETQFVLNRAKMAPLARFEAVSEN